MIIILTYQDFLEAKEEGRLLEFISKAIGQHMESDDYKTAIDADLYDQQQNVTINRVTRTIYTAAGIEINDPVSSNNRIASNFFHRLNTQRVTYLLGNGISFSDHVEDKKQPDGTTIAVDGTKEKFGPDFDREVYDAAYKGEIHGKSYVLVNKEHDGYVLHLFPITEFVPLLDEDDGALRAGIRFWSLEWGRKPVTAVLYEEDGYTKYRTSGKRKTNLRFEEIEPKRGYKAIIRTTAAHGDELVDYENYTRLPIVPFYGKNKVSALVGMRPSIDSYDIIQSGFANDLQDCAQIYWLIGGALGTTDAEKIKFREQLLFQHIGVVDMDNASITPYTQDIPYEARQTYLRHIRANIYETFGALDLSSVTSDRRTATEIEAAYQPVDEEADAFEVRVTKFIRQVLEVIGVVDEPQYKRNKISNQREQTEMIMLAADYLDTRTVLEKLPWISVDEIDPIMAEKDAENDARREEIPELNAAPEDTGEAE